MLSKFNLLNLFEVDLPKYKKDNGPNITGLVIMPKLLASKNSSIIFEEINLNFWFGLNSGTI